MFFDVLVEDVRVPVGRVHALADDDVATGVACAVAFAIEPEGGADDKTAAAAMTRAEGLALVDGLHVSE